MPITKSAKKALRQSLKHREANRKVKKNIKETLKEAGLDSIAKAYSVLDKAAKTNVIHPNKAARLKSRLTKRLVTEGSAETVEKPKVKKTAVKKATAKKTTAKKAKTVKK